MVLEGELHVDVDLETGEELNTRIRQVGDYAHKTPGDVHMERGGPEGALVLVSLYTEDGLLAETLASDAVIGQSTMEPILKTTQLKISLGKATVNVFRIFLGTFYWRYLLIAP